MPLSNNPDNAVIAKVLDAKQGKIGLLQLNAEKTLNSLTLSMVQQLFACLNDWEQDASVAAVVLMGGGDKAFCAGGDVRQLYQSATSQPGGPCEYGEAFFLHEYRLNYQIHTYRKPIICLGNGIVMGGGLGLMAGASHRVATETTRIAMPEITIGLFPDVGGTWFLNKMPDQLGIFFALTGAAINANDALYTGLANYLIPWNLQAQLIDSLQSVKWRDATKDTSEDNHALIDELLKSISINPKQVDDLPPSQIKAEYELIKPVCQRSSLSEIIAATQAIESDSKWLNKAKKTLANGSPLSSILIYEQLKRYRYANLKMVFMSELQLATNIIRYPEFTEGVRALLIDKDNKPDWKFKHFSEVPSSLLDQFFSAPWPENPLESFFSNHETIST